MPSFERQRNHMVDVQIAGRGIRDTAVLDAMRTVPRERFVRPGLAEFAYGDSPLPIEEAQTISQPFIVAAMIEAAELGPASRVLEIGAGSGYAAAVISRIAAEVHAIERHAALVASAKKRILSLGYDNITLHQGDGTHGWADAAPFDAILVAAGGDEIPPMLKEQLAVGGRLVIPVGEAREQQLLKITRRAAADYDEERLGAVTFVPLVNEQDRMEDGSRSARSRPHAD